MLHLWTFVSDSLYEFQSNSEIINSTRVIYLNEYDWQYQLAQCAMWVLIQVNASIPFRGNDDSVKMFIRNLNAHINKIEEMFVF